MWQWSEGFLLIAFYAGQCLTNSAAPDWSLAWCACQLSWQLASTFVCHSILSYAHSADSQLAGADFILLCMCHTLWGVFTLKLQMIHGSASNMFHMCVVAGRQCHLLCYGGSFCFLLSHMEPDIALPNMKPAHAPRRICLAHELERASQCTAGYCLKTDKDAKIDMMCCMVPQVVGLVQCRSCDVLRLRLPAS